MMGYIRTWRCDTCGKEQDDHPEMGETWPRGWFTVRFGRYDPFITLCSADCARQWEAKREREAETSTSSSGRGATMETANE